MPERRRSAAGVAGEHRERVGNTGEGARVAWHRSDVDAGGPLSTLGLAGCRRKCCLLDRYLLAVRGDAPELRRRPGGPFSFVSRSKQLAMNFG